MLPPQPPLSCPSSSTSFSFSVSTSLRSLVLHHRNRFVKHSFTLKLRVYCCNNNGQVETQQPRRVKLTADAAKRKRNSRPSFFEQIEEKWSVKLISATDTLPWQEPKETQFSQQSSGSRYLAEPNIDVKSPVIDPVNLGFPTRLKSAPWRYKRIPSTEKLGLESNTDVGAVQTHTGLSKECANKMPIGSLEGKQVSRGGVRRNRTTEDKVSFVNEIVDGEELPTGVSRFNEKTNTGEKDITIDERSILNQLEDFDDTDSSTEKADAIAFEPSSRSVNKLEFNEGYSKKRSNTEMAERMLPQHELQRLRNLSLRMLERFKVRAAGINQELVDSIHEKWKVDEVVKLKFEGPLAANMRRAHEILESRTGGLVVWKSGSSIVLYRGMAYNLTCVQSYNKQKRSDAFPQQSADVKCGTTQVKESVNTTKLWISDTAKYLKDMSEEELMELSDLNQLLDELGPRYTDWSGREPLPVDADLLPAVVSGYRPPFRLLPHGIRPVLRDKEMTHFRHLARKMPPHFALGRSRELQGLARAMVKLWETNAIAKIAIKRGVENTRNERMAEELKKLTGGTLLSRNKEYIVFYRGNDFLPPAVTEALNERQKQAQVQQDAEEQTRQMASSLTISDVKASPAPLLAGTLAETMAATSHWVTSGEDVQTMMRESALTKLVSLIRNLEMKLALAKGKLTKANKALAKLQEDMQPADLPTDLETITDEERLLYRRIGLSMKPYLLLGRRGVYSGTVENMHLHWKYREVVKIIVKGKNCAQVKHIAISLEAESGGVLVSLDKTTKGYAIIVYRGKNYLPPSAVRPQSLLTRREAMARSIELQRREALKYHILDLQERIELLRSELEDMKNGKRIDDIKTSYST